MQMGLDAFKKKTLFLWLDKNQFHAVNSRKRGVHVEQVYLNSSIILRAIRRAQIELQIPYISPWLSTWKRQLNKYDTIIIHASKITVPVVKYINRKKPDARIIVWYWNPVEKSVPISSFANSSCEIWSFDEMDCKKYGLNYNTQYYFNNIKLPENEIKFDVFFVGGDKGRVSKLLELEEEFNKLGLSTYFHITKTGASEKKYEKIYKKRISYQKILEFISKSRVILDFVSENQTGLTLRPLEALFFKKKLITNDLTIVDRDFYTTENIFVLGKDNIEDIPTFLNKPYKEIDKDIKNKYDFNNWLERFL